MGAEAGGRGAEDQPDWRDLVTATSAGRARSTVAAETRLPHVGPGLLVLTCADVIRPGVGWQLRFAPARRGLATEMARTRDSAAFAALTQACTQARVGLQSGQQALTWAMNSYLPGMVCRKFRRSRIVAFSTGQTVPRW